MPVCTRYRFTGGNARNRGIGRALSARPLHRWDMADKYSGNLYTVNLPYANFGIIENGGKVTYAAPIAKWAIGKTLRDVEAFYRRKGGQMTAHTQPEIKRIIMCGSRTWRNRELIFDKVFKWKQRYGDSLVIMHGDEPNGADEDIRLACEAHQVRHIIYCAAKPRHISHRLCKVVQASNWDIDGKFAGPKRNAAMRDNEPIGCVAFRSEGKSNGTDNCVNLCKSAGIPVIIYKGDGTHECYTNH